jgi:hypothetical protein
VGVAEQAQRTLGRAQRADGVHFLEHVHVFVERRPWQISVKSSMSTGPCGRAASQSRFSGVSAAAVHSIACRAR